MKNSNTARRELAQARKVVFNNLTHEPVIMRDVLLNTLHKSIDMLSTEYSFDLEDREMIDEMFIIVKQQTTLADADTTNKLSTAEHEQVALADAEKEILELKIRLDESRILLEIARGNNNTNAKA